MNPKLNVDALVGAWVTLRGNGQAANLSMAQFIKMADEINQENEPLWPTAEDMAYVRASIHGTHDTTQESST